MIVGLEKGHELLTAIRRHLPKNIPQKYGVAEPLRMTFDANCLDAAIQEWGKLHFMAEARNMSLHVNFGPPSIKKPRHSSVTLNVRCEVNEIENVVALVREIATSCRVDYAVAHILTRAELSDRLAEIGKRPSKWPSPPVEQTLQRLGDKERRKGFAAVLWELDLINIHTVQLRQCLPDLYWLSVFGLPYTNMFGRERMLAAAAESVEELSYGGIMLRLTKDLLDSPESWRRFQAIRSRCKKDLDDGAFCGASESLNAYRTPEFVGLAGTD